MNDLRTAAQQALEYMKSVGQADMHPEEWAIVERLEAALAQQTEPYRLPDDLYESKDWRDGTYAERVAWLHAMYESAKKERDALLYPPEPLRPPTGLEPRGCPLPGACSCPSESVRSTHSEECWQWHQACAVAEVIRLRAEVARMSKRDGE